MKIAVVHGLGFFYSGGGEKLIIQQVLGLRARGHDVECHAPVVDPRRCFPGLLERLGARALGPALPDWVRYRDAAALLWTSIAAPALAARLAATDVVLAANQPALWLGLWAKRLAGVPYIAYVNQPNRILYPREIDRAQRLIIKPDYLLLAVLARFARPLIERADHASVRGASLALANGRYIGQVLTRLYDREFISCPAGAELLQPDAERTRGELRVNGWTVRKPFVLLTNRHYPQKRFEIAISAMRHEELARRGTQLVITGANTVYTDRLRALTRSNGLADRVLFLGLTSELDLARLYAGAACYVYTSPEEDYGMGVVEAMGAGTPVVAWNAAGPSTTVRDDVTGFLVPPGDEDAFAARMADLVSDPELAARLGAAAREHVREELSLTRHLDRLEAALASVAR